MHPLLRHPRRHGLSPRRLASLATVSVLLAGGALVTLPAPVYAAQVSTHIEQEHPTLAGSAASVPTSATAAPAAPLTPDQAQQQTTAEQSGRLHATSEGIAPFTLLGVSARTPGGADALVRVHQSGAWGPWTALAFDGGDAPDPSSAEARAAARATGGMPTTEGLWFGASDGYELSLPAGSSGLTVQLARESTSRVAVAPEAPVTNSVAPDGSHPPISPRSSWGARPPKEAYDYAPSVEHAVVHHSVTQNVYSPADVPSILRSIQAFHQDARGWNDIAYNFAVDKFGGIWEARGGGIASTVIGGHALGANTSTTGIVALGDFSTASPPQEMVDSLGDLIGWKLYVHGVNPSGSRDYRIRATDRYVEGTHVVLASVIGHRDVGLTGCPGDFLYPRLTDIRARAMAKWAQMRFRLVEVNSLGKGTHDAAPQYSLPAGRRLSCDWNGDGTDTPVAVRENIWYLSDSTSGGDTTRVFGYGNPDDIPLCGDWNGDGIDTPGVFRNGTWYLTNTAGKPTADLVFGYGNPDDIPVTGDWNGDGKDTPGVVRSGIWCLSNTAGKPVADVVFGFANPGETPLVGDWDGNGTDTPGVVRQGIWLFTNTNGSPVAEIDFAYGNPDDVPTVGDWNGDHRSTPAVVRFP
jgi:hypothetical protein